MPSPGKASTLFQLHPRLSIVIIFAQSLMIILIIVTQPKYCWWSTFPRHPSPPPPPLGCWWTSPASWSGSPAAWPRPAHSFCSSSHLWGSSAPQRLCFLFASFLVEECQDVQISTAPSSGARCPERCHCAQNWGTSWIREQNCSSYTHFSWFEVIDCWNCFNLCVECFPVSGEARIDWIELDFQTTGTEYWHIEQSLYCLVFTYSWFPKLHSVLSCIKTMVWWQISTGNTTQKA